MPPRKRAAAPPKDDPELEAEALEPEPPEEEDEDEPEEENEPEESEPAEGAEAGEAGEEAEGDEEAETIIGFADEEEPGEGAADDNTVIRRIRDRNKELARENAELKKQAAAHVMPEVEIGPEPDMADFDFDETEFKTAWRAWNEAKVKADARAAEEAKAAEAANREWQSDLEAYGAKKAALRLADYEEVTAPVGAALSLPQQAVIIKAAHDPAAFFYALAGSETRLAELAKTQDPIKLAAAVARMEGGITVTTKKRKAPPPDKPARGGAKVITAPDKELERLEAEAEKTGNRTPVIRYKKRLAERGKKAA